MGRNHPTTFVGCRPAFAGFSRVCIWFSLMMPRLCFADSDDHYSLIELVSKYFELAPDYFWFVIFSNIALTVSVTFALLYVQCMHIRAHRRRYTPVLNGANGEYTGDDDLDNADRKRRHKEANTTRHKRGGGNRKNMRFGPPETTEDTHTRDGVFSEFQESGDAVDVEIDDVKPVAKSDISKMYEAYYHYLEHKQKITGAMAGPLASLPVSRKEFMARVSDIENINKSEHFKKVTLRLAPDDLPIPLDFDCPNGGTTGTMQEEAPLPKITLQPAKLYYRHDPIGMLWWKFFTYILLITCGHTIAGVIVWYISRIDRVELIAVLCCVWTLCVMITTFWYFYGDGLRFTSNVRFDLDRSAVIMWRLDRHQFDYLTHHGEPFKSCETVTVGWEFVVTLRQKHPAINCNSNTVSVLMSTLTIEHRGHVENYYDVMQNTALVYYQERLRSASRTAKATIPDSSFPVG